MTGIMYPEQRRAWALAHRRVQQSRPFSQITCHKRPSFWWLKPPKWSFMTGDTFCPFRIFLKEYLSFRPLFLAKKRVFLRGYCGICSKQFLLYCQCMSLNLCWSLILELMAQGCKFQNHRPANIHSYHTIL